MKRVLLAGCVLVLSVSSVSSSAQVVQSRNEPGLPTVAQTHVINRNPADAIPVRVQSGGEVQPVTIIGTPAVTFSTSTVISTRPVRHAWEYRRITVAAGQDPTSALNAEGLEGWEAVAITPTGAAGAMQVVLKRPR